MNSFHPPIRPSKPITPKAEESKGFLDMLAEKDDLLLYFTAFLGVVMPGVVYIVYHKVHALYMCYAEKKEAERQKEEKEKTQISIFYISTEEQENTALKKAEKLVFAMGDEKPLLHNLANFDFESFKKFRGFALFFIEISSDKPIQKAEEFAEWLEDLAADTKQKKEATIEQIKFAVLGLTNPNFPTAAKITQTVFKRLKIFGSTEIRPLLNIDITDNEEAEKAFQLWSMETMEAIDSFLPDASEHESILTESISDLSDLDDLDDNKKDR